MEENKLKKALTAAGIWSVAVGAVISGSYYGWNYIASETNFTGCLLYTSQNLCPEASHSSTTMSIFQIQPMANAITIAPSGIMIPSDSMS